MSVPRPITIVCITSYFKGNRFIQTCKEEGCTVLLLTVEKILTEPWCREFIDEVFALPAFTDTQSVIHSLSYLARTRSIDRLAPLDDYDVELVARLREHLRVPGMGETTARYFRDKLAMRVRAQAAAIPIPPFVHVLNHQKVTRFLEEVPPPWMFKPRGEASSSGITRCETPAQVWDRVQQLGDAQSFYLIEQMIPGDVYHVDSIVSEGEVVFAEAHRYWKPLFNVTHEGGIFATRTVDRHDPETEKLLALNQNVVRELKLVRGVAHTEFIRDSKGQFYFLETAARVGGAHIAELVEASTGVNLWAEWARIEIAQGEWAYQTPKVSQPMYAGLIVSLARQEQPDTSGFSDPEVCWRLDKKHHIGLIVRSPSAERVEELLASYMDRIRNDFWASLPASSKPTS